MSIKHSLVILASLVLVQPVFADEDMSADAKPCAPVIKSCLHAGYHGHGMHHHGKQFWQGCMKPLLMGETVKGVKVTAEAVNTCRTAKINELEQELNALKSVK